MQNLVLQELELEMNYHVSNQFIKMRELQIRVADFEKRCLQSYEQDKDVQKAILCSQKAHEKWEVSDKRIRKQIKFFEEIEVLS